jgi:hypothetical protein
MGHPHRPSTRYILPNEAYVIVYHDGKSPNMKVGVFEADFHTKDDSACADGSRLLIDVVPRRGDKPRPPVQRGRDVDLRAI